MSKLITKTLLLLVFMIFFSFQASLTQTQLTPVGPVLSWHTFLGSIDEDIGIAIAVDGSGNIYVAGKSKYTWGTPINPHSGSYHDTFVAKLSSSGTPLWHTFMGGTWDDSCRDMVLDGSGNVYVVGECYATWGTPVNPYSGGCEAFVVKLNSNGALQWHTYLGSSDCDQGNGIAVDTSGNVYVAGGSESSWGTPVNAFVFGGGNWDAFAAKLNSNGEYQWHTFMGSGSDDNSVGIAVDGSGYVYVTGDSDISWGAPVNAHSGGDDPDIFVAQLDSIGARQWNTFMGAAGEFDSVNGIVADGSGNTFVVGDSTVTWGSPVNAHAGGSFSPDAFAVKLNSSGAYQWNTFMGSTDTDQGYGIDLDGSGNVYVAGYSFATWGTPINPISGTGGPPDAFAVMLDSSGARQWNTFMGGTSGDYGNGIAADASGNVCVTGFSSATWGTPINPFSGTGGPPDAFVAKIAPPLINIAVTSPNGGEIWDVGSSHDITWTWAGAVGDVEIEYSTDNGSSWLSVISSTTNDGSHPWTVPDTTSTNCLVSVSEAADGVPSDVSDSVFTIQESTVQYTLTISTTTGGTTDPAPGDHDYGYDTPVEVDALPDSGYMFSYWSGDVPGGHETDNPITITMDGDKNITAHFAQIGWKSTKRLTWNPSDSNNPAVAMDSQRYVHMVWEDDNPGNYEIYYRKSTDGGVTWTSTKRLTWNSGDSRNPVIAIASNDNIHVVWDDDSLGTQEIFYRKSMDGGAGWTAVKRLTQLNGDSQAPSIAVDSYTDIHIVWFDMTPGNNEIYYSKSTNQGVSWSNPKRMTWNASSSSYPSIAAGSGNDIHVLWQDDGPGNKEIYYKRSTNGGTSWPLTKRMTWNAGDSTYPCITSDTGNNIHVVWTDLSPGNNEVFYKKSTNGGTNWPITKRLTWNGGASGAPSVATDAGDNIYVVWNDDTPGNYEIYYKRSTNGGGAWSTKRLTWNSGDSIVPDLATYSTGEIHIVWADDSPGNQEIYYKKGIQ